MTICKKSQEITTERGTITIYYNTEKFAVRGFWFVYYKRNGCEDTEEIRGGMWNKPTKRQIQNYIDSYDL